MSQVAQVRSRIAFVIEVVSVASCFLQERVAGPLPNLIYRPGNCRTAFVGAFTQDLSDMVEPARDIHPVSTALGIIKPHKLLHHDKVQSMVEVIKHYPVDKC